MNHYPHHIGDFNNATRHLTRVERALYRDMLDLYYDKETPLPTDIQRLARLVLAVTDEEKAALKIVLDEFFTLEDDGYHNARCDHEIAVYRAKIEQASRAGQASAQRRASARNADAQPDDNASSTPVEPPLNGRTTNQNQNQNQNHISTTDVVDKAPSRSQRSNVTVKVMLDTCPGLSEKVAADYIAHRKQKRAALTATAWDTIVKEIQLSGWTPDNALAEAMSAGWQGLKSDWLKNRNAGEQHAARKPTPQRRPSALERVRIANGLDPKTGAFLDDHERDAIPGEARRVG